jgi:capsular exopolysaccharide synthesis family protein
LFEEEQELESQIQLKDYLRILYRRKWLILAIFMVVMAISVYRTMNAVNIYEASTSVLVESKGTMERAIFNMNYLGNQTTLITNQLEILKSRTLAEQVVKSLNDGPYRDSLTVFMPNEEGRVRSLLSAAGWLLGNMEIQHRKDTDIIDITFSSTTPFECAYVANAIAEQFQQDNEESNKSEISETRIFLKGQIDTIGFNLENAEDELKSFQEREKVTELGGETQELIMRMAEVQSTLDQAEVELNSFQQKKQTLLEQLDDRKATLASDLSEISTPYLLTLQNELARVVADRTKFMIALESDLANPNRLAYEGQVKAYDDKIAALKAKLEEESNKIKTSSMVNDPFRLSQDLLSNLLTTESEIKALTAKITALRDVVKSYDDKFDLLPEKELQLARLVRNREVIEKTYIMMQTKLEEIKVTEAGQSGNIRIIDQAIEPGMPVSPNKRRDLMLGVLIGLGLGVGLVFVLEYFDKSIKSIEDIEHMGMNLLAAIPKIELDKVEKKRQRKWQSFELAEAQNIESRLVTHFDPKSPISEAYRTLRTNLQFSQVDGPLKTILVTSSGPKEGKSTTVANLAITQAQMGARVALIDTDLRRPVIHSIFGMEKEDGLTNYIMGKLDYQAILKKTIIENLTIVPSGVLPPNPSELLGSVKMGEFIKEIKQNFDIVLFDSPPVIAVTDAAILSTRIDGTLLVVSAGQTDREAVLRAKTLLENVKCQLVGTILNNVDIEGTYGSSYYYYYHYYYGANPKKGKKKRQKMG